MLTDFRILVTGSRDWADEKAIRDAIMGALVRAGRVDPPPDRVVLVHGACRGADILAERVAAAWQIPTEAHPADWDRHGRQAGPIRNRQMVELGADVVLAFPLGASPGTRGCIELAEAAGIPVVVHEGTRPDDQNRAVRRTAR